MNPDEIRLRIAHMVHEATDGAVTADESTPLLDLGVDSLGWLRLLDALESTFDVELDLKATELRETTVHQLAQRITAAVG